MPMDRTTVRAPREDREGGAREGGEGREGGAAAGGRRPFFRRRKSCPFSGPHAPKIDWKDTRLLGRYISERGKIMPSRITAVCQKKQRVLSTAIKRARYMAVLPYVRQDTADFRSSDR
ncbi:MAG: rpsR [Micavibrio sp.]|nr:rpsR [Micavibrio sp.]